MLVSIWRHGEAVAGSPDRERRLTERGHDDLVRGAPGFAAELRRRGLALPDRVLYSRWQRTTQTAELVCSALPGVPREPLEALIPGRDPDAVDTALQAFGDTAAHLLLVSHQPLVSELVDHWLGTQGEVPALTPGAYAVLQLPVPAGGCGSLLWWSSPPGYRV